MTFNQLQEELISSLKEHNKEKKNVLSSVINTAKNMAIAKKTKEDISDEIVLEAILKELKTIEEQISTCPKERKELMDLFILRKSIIENYAPKMLTESDIKDILEKDFKEILNTKNKGLIMKTIMPSLKGKADGKLINSIISEYLK